MRRAYFLRVLPCRLAFFRWKNLHYRGSKVQSVRSVVFYHANWHPLPGRPGSANTIEDSRTSGAVARKRCDPAKKSTVKYVTFGAKVAPFPSEGRGQFWDPPPLSGKWDIGARIACKFTQDLRRQVLNLPTLSKKRGAGPCNACKST